MTPCARTAATIRAHVRDYLAAVAKACRPEASHGAMQAPRGALTGMGSSELPAAPCEWHGPAQRALFPGGAP